MMYRRMAGMAAVLYMAAAAAAGQDAQPQTEAKEAAPGISIPPAVRPADSTAPVAKSLPNGVSYLCGGIGAEEAALMKSKAADYDVMLSFTAKDSGYLTNVDVSIADKAGKPVLNAFCGAPILLVNLPRSGAYSVRAETGGITLHKKITVDAVGKETASVVLAWPHQLAENMDSPAATSSGDSGPPGNGAAGDENEGPAPFDYRRHQ